MKLGVDIDGCLANFTDSYSKHLSQVTGLVFPKASDAWPTEWYWDRAAGVNKDDEAKVWKEVITAEGSDFWETLDHLDGAPATIKQLNRLAKAGHDVYFLTHRMGDKAKLQTEKWLYERGVDYPTVVMSGTKLPLVRAIGIQFFIDDKPETIEEMHDNVKLLYIKDAPYNRHVKVGKRVKSVREALEDAGLWL